MHPGVGADLLQVRVAGVASSGALVMMWMSLRWRPWGQNATRQTVTRRVQVHQGGRTGRMVS